MGILGHGAPVGGSREPEFPPTSGLIVGWLGLALGVAGLVWAVATFHSLGGVRLGLAMGVLILGSYAYLLRPRIRVREGVLRLVNPLEDVHIPLGLISRVTVRSATHVYVGRGEEQKRYIGVAVGRTRRTLVRADRSGVPTLREASMDPPTPLRATVPVPDLLEEWVGDLVTDARRAGPVADGVRRQPVWWLAAPLAGLTLCFVVSLFL